MPSHSHHPRGAATAAAALASLLAVVALTGCGNSTVNDQLTTDAHSGAEIARESDSLMLVVSVHGNVSAPDVPVELASTLEAAIGAELPIAVIAVDGDPAVSWSSGDYDISDANPAASDADVQSVAGAVITAVRGAVADSNGSDVMQGIRVARDKASANGSTRPLIVVLDSGLSDTTVDFTVPGLTLAEPAEVSAQLTDVLPELSGSSILLVGFGYAVAPQSPLSVRQTENVAAVWTAALTDAGASVSLMPVPRSDAGPDTTFTTRTVEPATTPTVSVTAPEPAVFGEASSLSFLPGTAEFRDPDAAETTIAEIASDLASAPDRSVRIMGTTAGTDTVESQIALATSRANSVRDGLIGLGVDASRIDAVGVGTQWDGYVYDVLPDGTLDPGAAALNRTVRISFPLS